MGGGGSVGGVRVDVNEELPPPVGGQGGRVGGWGGSGWM